MQHLSNLTLVLILVFIVAFGACGGDDTGDSAASNSTVGTSNSTNTSNGILGTGASNSTTTSNGSTATSDPPSCTDSCAPADLTQCNADGNVESCSPGGDGCLEWSVATICTEEQVCDQSDAADAVCETILRTRERAITFEASTCEDACSTLGRKCANNCLNGAGKALYNNSSNVPVASHRFTECSEPIPQEAESDGENHPLTSLRCCCDTPITEISGNIMSPISCNELCANNDAQCDSSYNWEEFANGDRLGGVFMTYVRSLENFDASDYRVRDCEHVPSLERWDGSVRRVLGAVRCACNTAQ